VTPVFYDHWKPRRTSKQEEKRKTRSRNDHKTKMKTINVRYSENCNFEQPTVKQQYKQVVIQGTKTRAKDSRVKNLRLTLQACCTGAFFALDAAAHGHRLTVGVKSIVNWGLETAVSTETAPLLHGAPLSTHICRARHPRTFAAIAQSKRGSD
jgi:hypothetical protein